MKLIFSGNQEDKKNFCNQVYLEAVSLCDKGEFEVEFKKVGNNRSDGQLRGYWRLCTNLVPYVKEKYGDICDKRFVSDLVCISGGYCIQAGSQKIAKSIALISKEDIGILIEKLYQICEFFGMKDYELTSSETRAMIEYYGEKTSK